MSEHFQYFTRTSGANLSDVIRDCESLLASGTWYSEILSNVSLTGTQTSSMIDITVLIATYNGQAVLNRVLEAYTQTHAGDKNWKLVIVDNASTDNTSQLIASYQDKLPIKYVYAPEPGKNNALNAGLEEVEGSIIVLSDDDAIPQDGFLNAWRDAFQRLPEFDIVGGGIHLHFDALPPDWFLKRELKFEELYAVRKGIPEGPIDPLEIYGPNMAVRKKVFSDGLRFNPAIGPNGADMQYAMGSENEFCARAAKLGYTTGFAPTPRVLHIVRPHQMTPSYWASRAYKLGRGVAKRNWEIGMFTLKKRSRLARWAICVLKRMNRAVRYGATLVPGPFLKFTAIWKYQFYCGFNDEHEHQKRVRRAEAKAL